MPHPLPLPPTSSSTYTHLISLLSSHPPHILELDILPSSYPPEILSSSSAIAIPKPLLASLFLTARHAFFSHLVSQTTKHPGGVVRAERQDHVRDPGIASSYDAAFSATPILLLWDPNHLTAANFRKRHLCTLYACPTTPLPETFNKPTPFQEALTADLDLLSSLLTSPLPKHPKAPTLWSHRLFLLRTFFADFATVTASFPPAASETSSQKRGEEEAQGGSEENRSPGTTLLWTHELALVMIAAERHPRNYYAWDYARQALGLISSQPLDANNGTAERRGGAEPDKGRLVVAAGSVRAVQAWCFQHPRDISGWAFLEFLLRALRGGYSSSYSSPYGRSNLRSSRICERVLEEKEQKQEEIREKDREEEQRVLRETREFTKKFAWRGGSVEWFLGVMQDHC